MILARRMRSRTLTTGDRREIGRYEAPSWGDLPGLGIGMMVDFRHISGMDACVSEVLYSCVRYVIPFAPRCLRWSIEMPSGPLDFEALMALNTSAGPMVRSSGRVGGKRCVLRMVRCILRLSFLCGCVEGAVARNCLTNAFDMECGVDFCLLLNDMAACVGVFVLPSMYLMVLQACCGLDVRESDST